MRRRMKEENEMYRIEGMFADPPPGGPPTSTPVGASVAPPPGKKTHVDFIFLYGLSGLNTYLVKHRALTALPLLLAIHRRQDVTGKARIPITPAVWKDAGSPSKSTRESMLAHLRRMPDLVSIQEDRNPLFRYRVEKGLAWRRIEKAGRENQGLEEETDLP